MPEKILRDVLSISVYLPSSRVYMENPYKRKKNI